MLLRLLILSCVHALLVAADVDRWEKTIAGFEARAGEIPAGGVVFYGSSTFTLWRDLAADFPGVPVINRGFGGSTTGDALRYAERVLVPLRPRCVVLYCGGNDIGARPPAVIAENTRTLLATIRSRLPAVRIVLLSLKPTLKRLDQVDQVLAVNRLYEGLAQDEAQIGFVDLWTPLLQADGSPDAQWLAEDGHHPSRAGYQRIAGLLRPLLLP